MLLITLIIGLLLTACGSNVPEEASVSDVDSLVETSVASTVAAAIDDDKPTVAVEPTIPANSGDATPLTPIPQYEEPSIEVSPEVEMIPEESVSPITTPRGPSIGDSAVFYPGEVVTLYEASLSDYYTNENEEQITREGYRYLLLKVGRVATEYYENASPEQFYIGVDLDIRAVDRDEDYFQCFQLRPRLIVDDETAFSYESSTIIFPGYERIFDFYCEVPITVADFIKDFKLQTGVKGILCDDCPIFDLNNDEAAGEKLAIELEETRYFSIGETISIDCINPNSGNLHELRVIFSNVRTTGISATLPSSRNPETEIVVEGLIPAALDFQITNLGKDDYYVAFRGLVLEPGSHEPRLYVDPGYLQTVVDTTGPTPPGGTVRGTINFAFDKRVNNVNLALAEYILHECTYNLQPYMIIETGLKFEGLGGELPTSPTNSIDSFTSDSRPPQSSSLDEITVSASNPKSITAIEINAGKELTIEYIRGSWRPGLTDLWIPVGPEGDDRVPGKTSFPLPDAPLMALVFGIEGSDEVYLFEGPQMTFTAPFSGALWFGPNDDDLDDNAGELRLVVSIE
jgi:hypothetical protein